jgi:UDP-N-acetylglucosamine--N-acetylmuramyl-(pentapeptide) pyrophosphoryl-undecaprenol N-acetylglucosamine transferase
VKILIAGGGTGGHLIPALVLADAMRDVRPDIEPVLVGAERGVEASILPERERSHRYYLLPVQPIYRSAWWKNVRWLGAFGAVLRESRRIVATERPALAIGTGGYAAGPILLVCSLHGIPIALQEQNAVPGVTTRLLARRARQIHLGFPEAAHNLRPGRHTQVLTFGNPIVPPADRTDARTGRSALGIPDGVPVCFVMGGSQGARGINEAVSQLLDEGRLENVALLWSTGHSMLDRYRRHHRPPLRQVRAFWDPVTEAYAASDLVVARAGAMTTAELSSWGLPSVLVPLPTAAADHQTKNAAALAVAGSAVCIPEQQLEPASLADQIESLVNDKETLSAMSRAAAQRGRPDAARRIVEVLLQLVD